MSARLDPDGYAALEAERDFLLGSLDDLDAELTAGDIDETDYDTLKSDYTRRAAEVLRAIDEHRTAFSDAPKGMTRPQRMIALAGVAIVAALAGVLLARSVGFRVGDESATGAIAQSTASLLAEAETLTFEREWDQAVEVYDEVLENEPSNVEALTYRGWLRFQLGDTPAAEASLADAVAGDPQYPDAHVFRALIYRADGRFDEAAAEIAILDGLDTPSEIAALVDSANLRGEVLAEQLRAAPELANFETLDVTATTALGAARVLEDSGSSPDDLILALRLRDSLLRAEPDNIGALIDQGRRLAATAELVAASPEGAVRGRTMLDRAIELDDMSVSARFWRAVARALHGDEAGARDDITVLESMNLSPEDRQQVEQLRLSIG